MADNFGTAIYTNCAPGQGVEGVGGMQFQALSAGVDNEALAAIERHLLYEPPERLIREHRPLRDFPPSFAHVHDGIFATASGVYVGQEADGPRQGNHLTHAIVTHDPRSYRTVRPAQLFRAAFWNTQPSPTSRSEPLAQSWRPGPLDAGEAGRFVNAQPDGMALLTALLSALQAHGAGGTGARRILFIAEHPDAVLSWLVAATLLIPQQDALRIGFKIFTTDPARSALPVVAVHPAWTTSAASVEQDRGYAVFDLVQHRWTELPEQPGAGHWARLFCNADPYEVAEAVELAAATQVAPDVARDLATTVVLRQPPSLVNARMIARWLQDSPPALREAFGGTLLDALAQVPDLDVLRMIDDVAAAHFPGRRDEIRLALLRLELDRAVRTPELPRVRTSRQTSTQRERDGVGGRRIEGDTPGVNGTARGTRGALRGRPAGQRPVWCLGTARRRPPRRDRIRGILGQPPPGCPRSGGVAGRSSHT